MKTSRHLTDVSSINKHGQFHSQLSGRSKSKWRLVNYVNAIMSWRQKEGSNINRSRVFFVICLLPSAVDDNQCSLQKYFVEYELERKTFQRVQIFAQEERKKIIASCWLCASTAFQCERLSMYRIVQCCYLANDISTESLNVDIWVPQNRNAFRNFEQGNTLSSTATGECNGFSSIPRFIFSLLLVEKTFPCKQRANEKCKQKSSRRRGFLRFSLSRFVQK